MRLGILKVALAIGCAVALILVLPLTQSTARATTPVRPSDTGLVLNPAPTEWPEDIIDRFNKQAADALARCDEASFNFWKAALLAMAQWVRNAHGLSERVGPTYSLTQDWARYAQEVSEWQFVRGPKCPGMASGTGQATLVPLPEQPTLQPRTFQGDGNYNFVQGLVGANVSVDSQADCEFSAATPALTVLFPVDQLGYPMLPISDAPTTPGDPPSNTGPALPDGPPTPAAPEKLASAPHTPHFDDGDNSLGGTPGIDHLTGGSGVDEFRFGVNPDFPTATGPSVTLSDGDRITDYEPFEKIIIEGVPLSGENIKMHYDPVKNETRIDIHFDDSAGRPSVAPSKTIILNGEIEGTVHIAIECCPGFANQTTIRIGVGEPPPASEPPVSTPPKAATPGGGKSVSPSDKSAQEDKAGDKAEDKAVEKQPVNFESGDTITIAFKATPTAIQAGLEGKEQSSALVMLTSAEPSQPGADKSVKTLLDKDFDKKPVKCALGKEKECTVPLSPAEAASLGIPVNGPRNYQAFVAPSSSGSGVIERPAGAKVKAVETPAGAQVTETAFSIGPQNFIQVDVVGTVAAVALAMTSYSQIYGPLFAINFCREKRHNRCSDEDPRLHLDAVPDSSGAYPAELPHGKVMLVTDARVTSVQP